MNLEDAKKILSACTRDELRDHAFGDAEVYWINNGLEFGQGYFSGDLATVTILTNDCTTFTGEDARQLRICGVLDDIQRNDETGPDEYVEGEVMEPLTLEAVRRELTQEP